MREAAEVVYTLWPKGNEGGKEVGQYSFVIDKLSAL